MHWATPYKIHSLSVEGFRISAKVNVLSHSRSRQFTKKSVSYPDKIYKKMDEWSLWMEFQLELEKSYIFWNPTGVALDIQICHSISTEILHWICSFFFPCWI